MDTSEAFLTVGGVVGVLIAAVAYLFKALVESKNRTIDELTRDRDYWRDVAMGTVAYTHPQHDPGRNPPIRETK